MHVYCYENTAINELRRNLSACREGEYEGLEIKMKDPIWKPDFGPSNFNSKTGAIAVGARNFLIAYNINLNTENVEIAKKIAGIIRESGTIENITGENSEILKIKKPGKFKGLKAIGWYIPQYGKVQVSTNITDINTIPLYKVFEEIKLLSKNYNIDVSGSEIIGLVPIQPIIESGKYYLQLEGKPKANDNEIIDAAIHYLGLNNVTLFIKEQRILEYLLQTV